jgi:TOMM system kinase/cyclase fusion protein
MQPDAATLASGSRFEDRYEIQGELGSGSFGRVYRARQLSTGQSVAIKLLSPREGTDSSTGREAERFRRETRICAALSHSHIVRLLDSGETSEGQLYAVFEHVPGETLEQALEREGRLSVREALRLLTQVLEALAAAHAQGIVHRDLKPANVMLSAAGARRSALVLDFGLGGVAEDRRRADWQTLTQTREFLGTPLYAAPEQLAGETPTERSDLYAWGLVFLECLTGRHPFAGAGGMERLLSGGGTVEIPEWLRGHRLGQLLERVTAREAAKRDVPVEALIEALDEIASGELPVAPEETRTPAPIPDTGERRHLTVMFCDLVGSTALSQRLDAETYREVVRAYQARGAEAVERYEGHVAQHLGDGLLVYFGYPQAHEDDAERAIRAGRELLGSLEVLSAQTEAKHGVAIAARVGIHTGPVVVGEMGGGEKQEVLALGDTVNIAARLEGFAEPGTVVISDATRHLVPGLFVTEDRGTPALKGIAEPIGVHRVLQPSGVRSRLERAPGLTPFVGREEELGLLVHRFEQAQEGQGQAVWVGGEAGIGKSRLVRELRERLRDTPHSWLECQTSPYTQSSALYPLIAMLEGALDFREEDTGEEKLGRLERGLAHLGLELAETVPLFAGLLSVRLPERYAPLELSPQLRRQKTLEALLAWLLALGEKQPVVLLVEDLHWIDPSTLEWLGLAIEQCATANLLLLLTHRPEFEPPWPARGHVLALGLNRLRRPEAQSLVAGAMAETTLPEELIARIAARSDGVPLFAEELAKGVVEAKDADAHDIPATLQDSLMARLDRLGETKQLAQLAAAIGREFPYALLAAVAPVQETELREGLGRLVEAELVYQRGLPPKATYTFKHALVQDTAYQSLLEGQRKDLHGRIADALEQRFPERVDRESEQIALHCTKAGRVEDAVAHYQRAGERATQHFAHAEAIGHLRTALELLCTLPESSERDRQELKLQVALGPSLIVTRSYGDHEVGRAYERARALSREIGESPELVRALVGLSLYYFIRGDLRSGVELAEQALALAERFSDAYPLLMAHIRLGINLYVMGETVRALDHFEQAIRLHDPDEHRSQQAAWGQGVGVDLARAFAAYSLWTLGHADRARRLIEEGVELARGGDPFDLAQALVNNSNFYWHLRDRDRTRERAEEAIAIARGRGFAAPLLIATLLRGWALGGSRGLEDIQQSLAQLEAAGMRAFLPGWRRFAAETNLELGRTEDALAELEAALAIAEEIAGETGAYQWLSELHRQKGEVFVQQGGAEAAERSFRRALQIARDQKGKSWELRAATSLARLLCDQGRRDEARALLVPVYDGFTEGFDTADLKDANALLEELA